MKFRMLLILLLPVANELVAQEKDTSSLMNMLERETRNENSTKYVTAIFKTTRVINGHSIENTGAGVMDVKISHRFGTVKGGWSSFFGLDAADTRIGVDYGINNWLMTGIGRSNAYGTVDAFFKAKLLRQSTGKINMPVGVSGVAAMQVNTTSWYNRVADDTLRSKFNSRLSYTFQLLIARKFTEGLSLQVSPTYIHFNLPPPPPGKNPPLVQDNAHRNLLSVGFSGRQKISKRASLNVEYFYQLPDHRLSWSENSFSVGFDIETGGHVFQFMFTNSNLIAENMFIAQTTDKWSKSGYRIGFNISRVFTVAHKHSGSSMK